MGKSQNLYKRAKERIPGGTQLLSKRPEMFLPDYWPAYYEKAKGCEVWDMDGNRYIDMSYMGIGACILGYADDDVNDAVKKAIDEGNMTTLNAPEELVLSEILCELHPWANMVRYARGGGDAMAVSVRIARAKSRKDVVLFCGYHGWHDWYLSANLSEDSALDEHLIPGLSPAGVPRTLKGTSYPFAYNDTQGFIDLINKYKNEVGIIVLETVRNYDPEKVFLETIRQVSQDLGIVVICDEVSSGWRLNVGGAHLLYDFEPDIAVFAKGMSNGYPMAAIIGKSNVMAAAQESFISSTYWTERIGPVAAIASIRKMKEKNVPAHLDRMGKKIQDGWQALARKHQVPIEVSGIYPLGHFSFKHEKPLVLKTLFTQLMLERGFLATTAYYASLAHKDSHIEKYLDATDHVFNTIAEAATDGNPEKYLMGPVCHSGFKRLT